MSNKIFFTLNDKQYILDPAPHLSSIEGETYALYNIDGDWIQNVTGLTEEEIHNLTHPV